ncbi:MAG: DUF421 domain-containing protein [Actinomycetota bacterium]|nr:DUF421 domain-containing protein [Actinomycetota bacterium]
MTVPVPELFVRGTVTFLALLVLMRMVGQREAGGLGITDLLLVVLVAQAVAPGLQGDAESVGDGLVVVATVLVWSVAIDAVSYRWPRVGRVLKAGPKLLIENGKPNRKVMRREFMTDEEVASMLRLQGIEDIAEVKRAHIEPNGMVSVVRRDGGETEAPDPPVAL